MINDNIIFFYVLLIKDVLVIFKDICMYLYLFLNGIFYINLYNIYRIQLCSYQIYNISSIWLVNFMQVK